MPGEQPDVVAGDGRGAVGLRTDQRGLGLPLAERPLRVEQRLPGGRDRPVGVRAADEQQAVGRGRGGRPVARLRQRQDRRVLRPLAEVRSGRGRARTRWTSGRRPRPCRRSRRSCRRRRSPRRRSAAPAAAGPASRRRSSRSRSSWRRRRRPSRSSRRDPPMYSRLVPTWTIEPSVRGCGSVSSGGDDSHGTIAPSGAGHGSEPLVGGQRLIGDQTMTPRSTVRATVK